jgi:nicotinamide mononucleotide (NMN) deamidase PncC
MFIPELTKPADRVAALLRARGDTVAVAEGSAGGLISAALLSVPGASAYYVGGTVIYTLAASRAWMAGAVEVPPGMRGATEAFALYLARSAAVRLGTTWGLGEAGAAGPPNRYGDPAGHSWVAVAGAAEETRHVLTGLEDRSENMVAFTLAARVLGEGAFGWPGRGSSRSCSRISWAPPRSHNSSATRPPTWCAATTSPSCAEPSRRRAGPR